MEYGSVYDYEDDAESQSVVVSNGYYLDSGYGAAAGNEYVEPPMVDGVGATGSFSMLGTPMAIILAMVVFALCALVMLIVGCFSGLMAGKVMDTMAAKECREELEDDA